LRIYFLSFFISSAAFYRQAISPLLHKLGLRQSMKAATKNRIAEQREFYYGFFINIHLNKEVFYNYSPSAIYAPCGERQGAPVNTREHWYCHGIPGTLAIQGQAF
jgi:hypothetical protein